MIINLAARVYPSIHNNQKERKRVKEENKTLKVNLRTPYHKLNQSKLRKMQKITAKNSRMKNRPIIMKQVKNLTNLPRPKLRKLLRKMNKLMLSKMQLTTRLRLRPKMKTLTQSSRIIIMRSKRNQ